MWAPKEINPWSGSALVLPLNGPCLDVTPCKQAHDIFLAGSADDGLLFYGTRDHAHPSIVWLFPSSVPEPLCPGSCLWAVIWFETHQDFSDFRVIFLGCPQNFFWDLRNWCEQLFLLFSWQHWLNGKWTQPRTSFFILYHHWLSYANHDIRVHFFWAGLQILFHWQRHEWEAVSIPIRLSGTVFDGRQVGKFGYPSVHGGV